MQKLKQLLLKSSLATTAVAFTLALGFVGMTSAPVGAQADQICEGVNFIDQGSQASSECDPSAESSVQGIVALVINVFSWIVGIISVIMIIIGGLKYILSSGDSNNINSAKNTILYAIIGLVVVALAQIIVMFVLGNVDTASTPAQTP